MTHILLPQDEQNRTRPVSFYLAMEEFVARELQMLDECFFVWRVEPSVIFGRNQLIDTEVNLDFCKQRGINLFRRKSGGGCVYADMGNLMFSYIVKGWDVQLTFRRYIDMVVGLLRSLGVEAEGSSRNDIMVDGRKLSGNAFYHIPSRSIVHGTMLYDTDMENMVGSISPSDSKLRSKGVESVRQRICLLKDFIGPKMSISQFEDYVCRYMCDAQYCLSQEDVLKIERIELGYHDRQYILGRNPGYCINIKRQIKGVGEFDVRIDVKNNIIRDINLMGDFFLVGDLDVLCSQLKGVCYERGALLRCIEAIEIDKIIMNLSSEQLLSLLLDDE